MDEEVETKQIWKQLKACEEVVATATVVDFLQADQDLATTGTRTLEEIAQSVRTTDEPIKSESEGEDETLVVVQPEPISHQKAYQGFDDLRRYIEENAVNPKLIQACHKLEDFLYQEQMKSLVQIPITNFMNAKKPDQTTLYEFLR